MPTGYIPIFEVYKDGENLTARFQDRALSIVVELAAGNGMQDSVVIVLDDRDSLLALPRVGDRLEVHLGYDGIGLAFQNSFEINEVRISIQPRIIEVRGTAASSISQLKSSFVKEYDNKTIQQVLSEAGQASGITVKVDSEIGNQKIPFLNNSSSFGSLVSRLEGQYDLIAKWTANGLSLVKRSGSGTNVSGVGVPTVVWNDPSFFSELEAIHNSRGEYKTTSASYYDKNENKRVWVDSASKTPDLQSQATHMVGSMFSSKEEAQAAADSTQAILDRSGSRLSLRLSEADPWIRDSQRVVISGVREGLDNAYLLDVVRHTFVKGQGMTTTAIGTAGPAALLDAYQSDGSDSSFQVVPPGGVLGMVPPPQTPSLPQPFNNVPSFVAPKFPTRFD